MSDAVWLAIIGIVAMIVKEYFDRRRSDAAAAETARITAQVKAEAIAAYEAANKVATEAARKAAAVAATATTKVEEVKKALQVTANDTAGKLDDLARAAEVNQAVTDATAGKVDDLAVVAKANHAFVNSGMGAQLKTNAALARRIADMTGDPADAEAATIAAEVYAEHQRGQDKVDAQPGTDAQKQGEQT